MRHISAAMQVTGSPGDLLSRIPPPVWWTIGVVFAAAFGVTTAFYLIKGLRALGRLMTSKATDERKAGARKAAGSTALYGLLYFFWAVAAGISMQGLIGFAEDNMGLTGPWPYLIFFALDGAAAFCMVLVTIRAGRAASTLTPRLAVWGLVGLSSWFNVTHAPNHPGAKLAWAAIPVIAGVLFELAQAETRNQAANPERRVSAIQWLHPVERVRVLLELASDTSVSADEATMRVREAVAAAWLYRMRTCLWPIRAAVRWRTRVALARADFAAPDRAEAILRRTQIFAQTDVLANLDYRTPVAARVTLGNLIGSPVVAPIVGTGTAQVTRRRPQAVLPGASLDGRDAVARMVPFTVPALDLSATTDRPVNGHKSTTWPTSRPVAGMVTALVGETTTDATGEEPDSDQDDDRKRPSEQVNRRAVTWVTRQIRAGSTPTKREAADRYGFSEGWAWDRIQEAKRSLVDEGWEFPKNSTPVPPASDA